MFVGSLFKHLQLLLEPVVVCQRGLVLSLEIVEELLCVGGRAGFLDKTEIEIETECEVGAHRIRSL